ncbi:hypothetical protein FJT64_006864 [Amphibalanus amphitrite]|uniref:Uncharacterized protein n=1 Tax=Amphibalanus amphitrite TaxID=1232801 RepID=A0A6A4VVN4_AMPAM|nr:hypothetical protein FJT64_006864 [Amphibalanus amphitrite]
MESLSPPARLAGVHSVTAPEGWNRVTSNGLVVYVRRLADLSSTEAGPDSVGQLLPAPVAQYPAAAKDVPGERGEVGHVVLGESHAVMAEAGLIDAGARWPPGETCW